MSELPVSAEQFFNYFSFSLLEYQVIHSREVVSAIKGMTNDDEHGDYIAFLYGVQICEGDLLIADEQYTVKKVLVDTYQGNPEMIKAYY